MTRDPNQPITYKCVVGRHTICDDPECFCTCHEPEEYHEDPLEDERDAKGC